MPVEKQTAPLPAGSILAERTNLAFTGTLVTYGQGEGVVFATGDQTEMGRIAGLIHTADDLQTPLTRRHFDNEDALTAFIERIPQGRPAQPAEIAAPACYLASDDAAYVNGASLLVDGAWAVSTYPDTRRFRGPVLWNG